MPSICGLMATPSGWTPWRFRRVALALGSEQVGGDRLTLQHGDLRHLAHRQGGLEERARWGGNPAAETRETPYQPAALAYEAQRDHSGLQALSNGKMR